jgi:hypothetical protein
MRLWDKKSPSLLKVQTISMLCAICGVTIQDATAKRNAGLFQPCAEGRTVRKQIGDAVEIPQGRSIDWQCIVIEKRTETDDDVTYRFVADIWEPNPEIRGRLRIAGQAEGSLRLIKSSGEVQLDQPMPGDANEKRFNSAARKIKQHWSKSEYPKKTMFACG